MLALAALVATDAPTLAQDAVTASHEICIGLLTGTAGTRVSVPITLDDGNGVAGLQIDIHFDPAALSAAGARLGADTSAAGVWIVDSALRDAGLLTVLLYSNPPRALTAGFKRMAIIDFDVLPGRTMSHATLPLSDCILGDVNALPLPCAVCLQPGATIATPRFEFCTVQDDLLFDPASITVEQGDWVLWENVGSSLFHTTTSGTRDAATRVCTADGAWRGELQPNRQFVRQFPEPGGSVLPYFCEPDCAVGQTGTVAVSDPIVLSVSHLGGLSRLTWSGGVGRYVVHRCEAPSFLGITSISLDPEGGETGLSLTEPAVPALGHSFFYLVTNKP